MDSAISFGTMSRSSDTTCDHATILPNEEVAAELMDVANGHFEFMQEKSYQDGPLKLIQYYISSGPEWKESASFLDGKTPEKTGRVVMTLVEIYETEDQNRVPEIFCKRVSLLCHCINQLRPLLQFYRTLLPI